MVSSVVSSVLGASASRKAASTQDNAAQAAADRTDAQYQQARKDLEPYSAIGTAGVNRLSDMLGLSGNTTAEGYGSLTKSFSLSDFEKDPGYQFRLDEGAKALERSASAKGGVFSGAAGKALTRYNQDFASNEYDKAYDRYNENQSTLYNRLTGATNIGQNAVNAQNNLGENAVAQANDYRTSGAAARAAGTIGVANSYIGGINSIQNQLAQMASFGVK